MIKANELRAGNFHEAPEFSIPRMGISSPKINGKCWNSITSEQVKFTAECMRKLPQPQSPT